MTSPGRALRGRVRVPGDKSVTHRALLLGAVARGTSVVSGALDALDTRSTAGLVAALGASVNWPAAAIGEHRRTPGARSGEAPAAVPGEESAGTFTIRGVEHLASPPGILDCGNAGTAARLVLGLLAGRPGRWVLDGDASLRSRPMARVADPLRLLGAEITGERLPVEVLGCTLRARPLVVDLPSAQVKSALLLAGLAANDVLSVVQHIPTRDHTERMLPAFGVRCEVAGDEIRVHPGRPRATALRVPADPSAAAFLVVAALLCPGSDLVLEDLGGWPRRTGFLETLRRAGARLEWRLAPEDGPDPRGELRVCAAELDAFEIAPDEVPDLVDEIPILALAAARARGVSRFAGLAELRVKESDRVSAVARLLDQLGVAVEVTGDELSIKGRPGWNGLPRGPHGDHRLALSAAVARHVAGAQPLPDEPAAAVSWPGFGAVLAHLSRRC